MDSSTSTIARRPSRPPNGDEVFTPYTLYATTLVLGMRQGEVLGLRWAGVDLERRTLRVRTALQWLRGDEPRLVEPKTRQSKRPLPAMVVELLKAHRIRQEADRLKAGAAWVGDDWDLVFCSLQGRPLNSRHLLTYFKAILRKADLPNIRFHDLRHSCASLLVAQGLHPRVVMEQLGHSTIKLTMGTYSHVLAGAAKTGGGHDGWAVRYPRPVARLPASRDEAPGTLSVVPGAPCWRAT